MSSLFTLPQQGTQATLDQSIQQSWKMTPPFWPLQNLVAINPLSGLEHLPFEEALHQASLFFCSKNLPKNIRELNLLSIKWLQLFFDQGQATLTLPMRDEGLLHCLRQVIACDLPLSREEKQWLDKLPKEPLSLIAACTPTTLSPSEQTLFFTLMLTTLPGWASHVSYLHDCYQRQLLTTPNLFKIQQEYLAFRIITFLLLNGEPTNLLKWHTAEQSTASEKLGSYTDIQRNESRLIKNLLTQLRSTLPSQRLEIQKKDQTKEASAPLAQFMFCMDVRSEPVIYQLEKLNHYQIFSMPGFFASAVSISPPETHKTYASCPVLLTPKHTVQEVYGKISGSQRKSHRFLQRGSKLFYLLKNTFSAPFALVETLGLSFGIWMALKTLFPHLAYKLKRNLEKLSLSSVNIHPIIDSIPWKDQCQIALQSLKSIGLSKTFTNVVIICGHKAESTNNAFASALNCGACGGQNGAPNARILSCILNQESIREYLSQQSIIIPKSTLFLPAAHNTTTDTVEVFTHLITKEQLQSISSQLDQIQLDLKKAQKENIHRRMTTLTRTPNIAKALHNCQTRAKDWAQVRPEWGLAKNYAMIIGPRTFSQNSDLEGRVFLHSYAYEGDTNYKILTSILTAPMLVAFAINSQYLFSTLNNSTFGAGSKVTKNVTGKFGAMQGNGSDLMQGLPLQSVFSSDTTAYHEISRLVVVIHAPKTAIQKICQMETTIKRLVKNEWIYIICFDPRTKEYLRLNKELDWSFA